MERLHEHYLEFAKWFKLMDEISNIPNYSNKYNWVTEDALSISWTVNVREWTIEEIYQYWLYNVIKIDENVY